MLKWIFLPLLVVGLAARSTGFVAGGVPLLAHDGTPCADQATPGPFMGMADPHAPYDLRFIDEMIMHHQGAIMSSAMMIADSEHPELRDLARRIDEGQQRQIDQMRVWRAQWYPDADPPAMDMNAMGGMDTMDTMDTMDMMGGMMGGDEADRMFLQMMIPHHQLAIDMAEDALDHAEHEELKGLARTIIREQSAEIAEMERYLREWYGDESTRSAADAMQDRMRTMMGVC